ncbi:MAG TPA: YgeY family selenium metabolism-linked hydrolase [Candidatus Acidoferrum sp.]|nr:YgeY family selenium metabolism-linked hydrolase [Candidatus Acidoferrum sp.]
MNERVKKATEARKDSFIRFVQELVRIPSFSDHEGDVAKRIEAEMKALGYDEVRIDKTGNVVGRMGSGDTVILFDSHMDTVEVHDAQNWVSPPFSGDIVEGRLYGRGSVDMKGALAASVYAAAVAKELGLLAGKRVYVSGTVCEEYCDGESLKTVIGDMPKIPDCCVICEPSDNIITLGHKGKAQIRITTHGVSAHGSAPEKGVNAVYEMAEIITRVDALNKRLFTPGAPHGTIVLSDISCVSASLNAVPSECGIYLDRRLILGETVEDVKKEIEALIAGKRASWEVGTLRHTSWTGDPLVYEPIHNSWKIDEGHPLTLAFNRAYEETFGKAPDKYDFWDFGTNAVTPVSMGIPTIGFGPGEYKLAHMLNENVEVEKLEGALAFYANVIDTL